MNLVSGPALAKAGWPAIDGMVHAAEAYASLKRGLEHSLGTTDDLLHVHVGLALFVLAALVMRRRMRSWWPLAIVVVFALGNEIVDLYAAGPWSPWQAAGDVANTVVWPLALFLVARRGKVS